MIKITFPDGSIREYKKGTTAVEIAGSISVSLVKKCLAVKLNGQLADLKAPIEMDASIELITGDQKGMEPLLNHSCAHLLAQAIKELYPNAMFGVGPAIEEGFYYDLDLGDVKLTEEDLVKIEKKMKALAEGNSEIERRVVSKEVSKSCFSNRNPFCRY